MAFFASSTGYYPTRMSSYELPEMKAALEQYPQFQVAVDELRATEESPATAGAVFGTFAGARPLVEEAMEAYMLGTAATAEDALNDAADKANEKNRAYPDQRAPASGNEGDQEEREDAEDDARVERMAGWE